MFYNPLGRHLHLAYVLALNQIQFFKICFIQIIISGIEEEDKPSFLQI